MSEKFFLTEKQLEVLSSLVFNVFYYRRINHYCTLNNRWEHPEDFISKQKPLWDKKIFRKLLKKSPELEPLVDSFWEDAKKFYHIEWVTSRG